MDLDNLCRKARASGDYRGLSRLYGAAVDAGDYETAQRICDGSEGIERASDDPSFQADMAARRVRHNADMAQIERIHSLMRGLKTLFRAT